MTERTGGSLPRHRSGAARCLASAAAMLALAGCVTAPPAGGPADAQAVAAPPSVQPSVSLAPVPAAAPSASPGPLRTAPVLRPQPELFEARAAALWDGGRTPGGVWVALAQVDRARRVRMTNEDTGAVVDGALLRSRLGTKGPELEISSEAASALGLTPGVPAPVSIVALAYAESAAPLDGPAEAAEAAPGDPSEAPPPAVPPEEAAPAAAVTEAAPAPEPEPSGAGAAMAVPAESVPQAPVPSETVPTATVPPAPVPGSGPAAAAPASADAPPESAAAPEPEPAAAPASEPPVAPSVEPAVAPAQTAGDAAPADAPIADGKPFIQVGIFGGGHNADRLVALLEAAGLPASRRPLVRGDITLTRVLVGPFGSLAERDRALATVRRIGPADAYPVKG